MTNIRDHSDRLTKSEVRKDIEGEIVEPLERVHIFTSVAHLIYLLDKILEVVMNDGSDA